MKNSTGIFSAFLVAILVSACFSGEIKSTKKKVTHVGEKWNITSVEYNIVDQKFSSGAQTIKNGTATNAGAFYFDGSQGSFDIVIDPYHKEDVFGYSENPPSITVNTIDQNVGGLTFSQSVIAFSGEKDGNTITIDGTITEQTTSSQFVLTGTFVLTKD